jgi:diamine N-acetyltransferase
MVRLSEYSNSYYPNVSKLRVHDFQKRFVWEPVQLISKLEQDETHQKMCVILHSEKPCGAFLMKEYALKEYFLWQMIIDKDYQGQGIGKAAIKDMIQKLKNINAKKVTTTVVKDNDIALKFFQSVGFKKTDEGNNEVNLAMDIYYD